MQFSVYRTPFNGIQCIVYSVQCTVYSVQCTVYSIQYTVYSVQCTVYSVHCTYSVIIYMPGIMESGLDASYSFTSGMVWTFRKFFFTSGYLSCSCQFKLNSCEILFSISLLCILINIWCLNRGGSKFLAPPELPRGPPPIKIILRKGHVMHVNKNIVQTCSIQLLAYGQILN